MTRYHEGDVRRKRARKRREEKHPYANLRLLWDTRWTPNNEEFHSLLMLVVEEAQSVKSLAEIIDMKYRHLRRIVRGETKAVSYAVADRIFARSGIAYKLRELPWYTVEELQDMGIWNPQWGNPLVRREDDVLPG